MRERSVLDGDRRCMRQDHEGRVKGSGCSMGCSPDFALLDPGYVVSVAPGARAGVARVRIDVAARSDG